jgi:conjugal transfer/entry exclusion protein
MKIKLSLRETIISFTALLVVFYFVFDFFLYSPKLKEQLSLRTALSSVDQKLQETAAFLTGGSQVAFDVGRMEKKLSFYEEKFSTRESFAQLLEQFALQCQKLNMEIISLKPTEEQTVTADAAQARYRQISLDIQLRGDFPAMVRFIQAMEQLPIFTLVDQLTIRRDEKSPAVTCQLILKTLIS